MKQLAILFVFLSSLLVIAVPASACAFEQLSAEMLMSFSTTVFRAQVTEVKVVTLATSTKSGPRPEVVEARYTVLEILKGKPSGVVRESLPVSKCNLGLTVGSEYLFVPNEHQVVSLPTGSLLLSKDAGTASTQRLQALRKLASSAAK